MTKHLDVVAIILALAVACQVTLPVIQELIRMIFSFTSWLLLHDSMPGPGPMG